MTATPALRVENLRFAYRADGAATFRLALDAWTVARGERWALHGPSGCGKSTVLDLVAGVLRPGVGVELTGRIELDGHDLATLSESARRALRLRRVGFVFQDFPLIEYLDVLDNVLLPYRLHSALRLDDGVRRRARDLLTRLGLGEVAVRLPAALSQGERQRVAIARALVAEPSLVLADEPTAGLDPARGRAVLDLLHELADERELSLVVVTHDPAVRARFEHQLDVGALSSTEVAESAESADSAEVRA
ncbi:MAG: ATP-binding cassette domain-containing protein [Acidobacteriota bacterium]